MTILMTMLLVFWTQTPEQQATPPPILRYVGLTIIKTQLNTRKIALLEYETNRITQQIYAEEGDLLPDTNGFVVKKINHNQVLLTNQTNQYWLPLASKILSGYASDEHLPDEYAPDEYAPDEYAPDEYAPDEYAPDEYAPDEYAPDEYAPDRYQFNLSATNPYRDYDDRLPYDTTTFSDCVPAYPSFQFKKRGPQF